MKVSRTGLRRLKKDCHTGFRVQEKVMSNGFRSKKLKAIRPPVLPGLALSSMKKTTSESHSYYLSIYIYIYIYTYTHTHRHLLMRSLAQASETGTSQMTPDTSRQNFAIVATRLAPGRALLQ